jgi:4-hydroxy-2-oxoglutarate aldolase
LGSTGERVHLDEDEYDEVVRRARQEVPGGLRFIVGAGQQSTLGTIKEIKRVTQSSSIDAVLVITPGFYRTSITQSLLIDYYRAVADEAPVPVILYSMPALTGIRIEPETAASLAQHQNIIGIKDSSPDVAGLKETVAQGGTDFAVLTGNGTVLDQALLAGACGAILAVGCVAPAVCLAIMQAVKDGDFSRAATLQSALSPLAAAVTTRFGLGGLKTALEMIGYSGGVVRSPLKMPDEAARNEIRECLQQAECAIDS